MLSFTPDGEIEGSGTREIQKATTQQPLFAGNFWPKVPFSALTLFLLRKWMCSFCSFSACSFLPGWWGLEQTKNVRKKKMGLGGGKRFSRGKVKLHKRWNRRWTKKTLSLGLLSKGRRKKDISHSSARSKNIAWVSCRVSRIRWETNFSFGLRAMHKECLH